MMRKIFSVFLIILIFFGVFYFVSNSVDYYDPLNGCYIKINGNLLSGNEDTIREALKKIKNTNFDDYSMVCKFVDKILENDCLTSDPHFGRPMRVSDGCYIKGSKFIYLKADKSSGEDIINKRVDSIIKYSNYSRDNWSEDKIL